MSCINILNLRYQASADLLRDGVEIVIVGDPLGARFKSALHSVLSLAKIIDDCESDALIAVAKKFCWKLLTQPQPLQFNSCLVGLSNELKERANRVRKAIGEDALLDELVSASIDASSANSSIGAMLMKSMKEIGIDSEVVIVAADRPAALGIKAWLQGSDARVVTVSEFEQAWQDREQAYVIGPPRLYPSALVTAPTISSISFLYPAWFSDSRVPGSAISSYAEGAIRVGARIFREGKVSSTGQEPVIEDLNDYFCQPLWGPRNVDVSGSSGGRVKARKLLLSGDFAIWLDNGSRIRAFDPQQPEDERVVFVNVSTVCSGSYLLLRIGETERGVLYKKAIKDLPNGNDVVAAQNAWKNALLERIDKLGHVQVMRELRDLNVKAANQVEAWVDADLIRPRYDYDFTRLLEYLKIPMQPTYDYATYLRKKTCQISKKITVCLEKAMSVVDTSELELKGHLKLDLETEGLRGLLVARVLAVSPFEERVARSKVRIPFEDYGGHWLE